MNVLGTSWWFAQISHLMISTIITFWHVVCINSFQIFSDKITQDNKKNLSECFLGAKSVFSPYFEMTIYPEKTSASPLKLSVFFFRWYFRIYLDVFSFCFLLNGFYHGKPCNKSPFGTLFLVKLVFSMQIGQPERYHRDFSQQQR